MVKGYNYTSKCHDYTMLNRVCGATSAIVAGGVLHGIMLTDQIIVFCDIGAMSKNLVICIE